MTDRSQGARTPARVEPTGATAVDLFSGAGGFALGLADALEGLPAATPYWLGSPHDHIARVVSVADRERIPLLRQGQTMRDLPEELWHQSYRRRANRRVADGVRTEQRGGAPAGLRRLLADEPSKAITSAASREFIHPVEDRPLTLRECARLQTFPDWFEFVGNRADRATMIGNAVPPMFARSIGSAIARTLAAPLDLAMTTGSLRRFDPTSADGMSPALASAIALVTRRYGIGSEEV